MKKSVLLLCWISIFIAAMQKPFQPNEPRTPVSSPGTYSSEVSIPEIGTQGTRTSDHLRTPEYRIKKRPLPMHSGSSLMSSEERADRALRRRMEETDTLPDDSETEKAERVFKEQVPVIMQVRNTTATNILITVREGGRGSSLNQVIIRGGNIIHPRIKLSPDVGMVTIGAPHNIYTVRFDAEREGFEISPLEQAPRFKAIASKHATLVVTAETVDIEPQE